MATLDKPLPQAGSAHLVPPRTQAVIDTFDRYVVPNYKRFPVCLVRGQGSRVWDAEGAEYLDLFPGWGCNLLGHCPEPIVQAVQEHLACVCPNANAHVQDRWQSQPMVLCSGEKPGTRSK